MSDPKIVERQDRQRASALATADEMMQRAKARFSLAALSCLRGATDAAEQVAKALAEVDAARAALRQAEGRDA